VTLVVVAAVLAVSIGVSVAYPKKIPEQAKDQK